MLSRIRETISINNGTSLVTWIIKIILSNKLNCYYSCWHLPWIIWEWTHLQKLCVDAFVNVKITYFIFRQQIIAIVIITHKTIPDTAIIIANVAESDNPDFSEISFDIMTGGCVCCSSVRCCHAVDDFVVAFAVASGGGPCNKVHQSEWNKISI